MFAEFEKQNRIVCLVKACYVFEPTILIRKEQQKSELALNAKQNTQKVLSWLTNNENEKNNTYYFRYSASLRTRHIELTRIVLDSLHYFIVAFPGLSILI